MRLRTDRSCQLRPGKVSATATSRTPGLRFRRPGSRTVSPPTDRAAGWGAAPAPVWEAPVPGPVQVVEVRVSAPEVARKGRQPEVATEPAQEEQARTVAGSRSGRQTRSRPETRRSCPAQPGRTGKQPTG